MTYTYITIRGQNCSVCSEFKNTELTQSKILIHSQKEARVKCSVCNKTWVIRKGTIFYRLKTSPLEVKEIIDLLDKGESIRTISEKTHKSKSTIMRIKKRLYQLT